MVLLSCPLWSQQQADVLPQMENRKHKHSVIPQHTNTDQKSIISDEIDFLLPNVQNNEISIRVDSIFFLDEDGNFKEYYVYDAKGNILTDLIQEWENGEWLNYKLYTYTYNYNGNRLSYLKQYWENNEWLNDVLYTYTYDANENRLTHLHQNWESGEWVNHHLYTSTYDDNGDVLSGLNQNWGNNDG